MQVTVDTAILADGASKAVSGNMTPEQALGRLLDGSGITWSVLDASTVSLKRSPQTGEDKTIRLGPVRVEEGAGTTEGIRSASSVALFAETPLIEVPFSIGVYTETLIEDQRAFTLKEVLQNDPSVSLQMPGGYYGFQNLGSRGFRVDNFNGYRLDGLPMINTVVSSIDGKSRVELLKGPAALRFGFMPPGGAINLVRKRPTLDLSVSLQFDTDTFGSLYSQIDVSDTLADGTFGYRMVIAGDKFDSFYDKADGDRLTGSLFTEWKPSQSIALWASIGAQDFERSGYYGPVISASGLILDTGVKTNIMQDWARNRHETLDAAIGSDITFSENWKLRASLSYQDAARESRLSYPYSVEDNGDYTEGAQITNGPFEWTTWGAHLHLEGGFATGSLRHDIVVGAQYVAYDSFGQRGFPDVGPNNAYQLNRLPIPEVGWGPPPGKFKYKEAGFFATDTVAFNEKFSALIGVRHGRYRNIDPDPAYGDRVSAWSPTLALMYAPVDNVHTYVTWTRGLQDGGADEDTGEPLGVQKSEQWEAGVKGEWVDGRVTGEAAVFQIEQDLAIADPSGTDRFSGLRRHRGLEMALRGSATDHLQVGVATMFLNAEQIDTGDPALDGKRPQYVPRYQVNVWGALTVPQVSGLSITANARFVDGQYLDQMEKFSIGSYWVLDFGARYRFKVNDTELTLRLNVKNALDKRYYESGEFYAGDAGYLGYGAPRSANLSVALNF